MSNLCLFVYLAICDSRAALPLRKLKLESAGICQARKNWQACSVPNVLLLFTALPRVTLSGETWPPPRGRPLSVILLFGQMDAAGTASTSSWLHVCPLQGHLTPAHFDKHVFCQSSFPLPLVGSNVLSKWITKITWKLGSYTNGFNFPKSERTSQDCRDVWWILVEFNVFFHWKDTCSSHNWEYNAEIYEDFQNWLDECKGRGRNLAAFLLVPEKLTFWSYPGFTWQQYA